MSNPEEQISGANAASDVVCDESPVVVITEDDISLSNFIKDDNSTNIILISGGTIIIDKNIIGRNGKIKNVFMLANKIHCDGNYEISLEGEDGKRLKKAPNGRSWGYSGENGCGGVGGGHGGNCIIVAKAEQGSGTLTIKSRGGKGGPGQDGGDGHCGFDEEYARNDFCNKISATFDDFDNRLMDLCNKMQFINPNLEDYKLQNSDKIKTPNSSISSKIWKRVIILATIKSIIKFVLIKCVCVRINLEDYCFCQAVVKAEDWVNAPSKAELFSSLLIENLRREGYTICFPELNRTSCKVNNFLQKQLHLKKYLSNYKRFQTNIGVWDSYLVLDKLEAMHNVLQASVDLKNLIRDANNHIQHVAGKVLNRDFAHDPKIDAISSKSTASKVSIEGPGGGGGVGGSGGNMGCPGIIKVICNGLEAREDTFVKVLTEHGNEGKGGTGGKGSKPGKRVDDINFPYTITNGVTGLPNKRCGDKCKQQEQNAVSEALRNIRNCIRIWEPTNKFSVSLLTAHEFGLKCFLSTDIFVNEYLRLSRPTTTSSRERCADEEQFQKNLTRFQTQNETLNADDNKILAHLLTFSHFKTTSLRGDLESSCIIVDVGKYLETSITTINKFRECKRLSRLVDYNGKFNIELENSMIQEGKNIKLLIKSNMEEIENIFEKQIQASSDDVNSYIYLIEKQAKYKHIGKVLKILDKIIDPVSRTCGQLGIWGAVIGGLFKGGTGAIVELVAFFEQSFEVPDALSCNPVNNQKRFLTAAIEMLTGQTELLEKIIAEHPALQIKFKTILEEMSRLRNRSEDCWINVDSNQVPCDTLSRKVNQTKFKEFANELEKNQNDFLEQITSSKKSHSDDEISVALDYLYLDVILNDIDHSLYNKKKETKVKKLLNFFGETKATRLAKLRKLALDRKYIPGVRWILANFIIKLEGAKTSEMPQLSLQDFLLDVKEYFLPFVKGLPSEDEFLQGFRKLQKVLDSYIFLWSRIEKTEELKRLAKLFSGMTFVSDEFGDLKIPDHLKLALLHIKHLTVAHLLLAEYGKIKKAFLRWTFPYADKYLIPVKSAMQVIESLGQDESKEIRQEDIEDAAEECSNLLEYFRDIYKRSHVATFAEDQIIYTHPFYHEEDNQNQPFYEWRQDQYQSLIQAFFQGEETTFMADICNSPKGKGAIKMDGSIDLMFRFIGNDQDQDAQKRIMKHFILEMTHSGTSYYRVGNDYYYIETGKLILVSNAETSFPNWKQSNIENRRKTQNQSRAKITDYVFSPYTEWKFRLRLAHPDLHEQQTINELYQGLEHFGSCVDIQLVGWGQYIDEGASLYNNCKPKNVSNYYKVYQTISNTSTDENAFENL